MCSSDLVDIQGQVSGPLKSTHFTEGEIVKEGDLLATIDPQIGRASCRERV